jgi:hypothetical protein
MIRPSVPPSGWKMSLVLMASMAVAGCSPQPPVVNPPIKPPIDENKGKVATESPELVNLRDEVYALRVENQKATNLVAMLKEKVDKEKMLSPDHLPSEPTQTEFAKAQVDLAANLKELRAKVDELLAKKPVTLTEEDIKKIVDAVQPPPGPIPLPDPQSPPPSAGSSDAEAKEALKALATAAAAALCVAQPEICPFLGPIMEMLGLFGSTEEKKTFLDAVGNFAKGEPLTDSQAAVIKKATETGFLGMHEAQKKLLEKIGEGNPPVKAAVEVAKKKLLGDLGIKENDYEELKKVLSSKDSDADKLKRIQAVYPVFPNPKVREHFAKLAQQLGGKALGDAVRGLPAQ